MNDKKTNKLYICTKILLLISLGFSIFAAYPAIEEYFLSKTQHIVSPILLTCSAISYICILAIIFELILINNLVINKEPFICELVNYIKKISIFLFIIALCVFIKNWFVFQGKHFFAFSFKDGSISTDMSFTLFIFLGLLTLILSNVLKEAIKIKNENDLTV